MPLDLMFGPGIVFDMTHKQDGEEIGVADLTNALSKIGVQLSPGTIAMIRTGRDRFQGQPDYWKLGTGVSAAATEWLIDHGVRVMGIDQWGWDLPFHHQIRRSKSEGRNDLFWAGHLVGRRKPYWHIEQLRGLDALPAQGFDVGIFPLRLKGASAAPARVVGFLYD